MAYQATANAPSEEVIIKDEGKLREHLQNKGASLLSLYDNTSIRECAERADRMVLSLSAKYGFKKEQSLSLALLTLYDLTVLIGITPFQYPRYLHIIICRAHVVDDSESMRPPQVKDLGEVLVTLAEIYELARPGGISSLQFFNDHREYRDVKKEIMEDILRSTSWWGNSRPAWSLRRRVLEPYLSDAATASGSRIERMRLILIITDGQVEGEHPGNLVPLLKNIQEKEVGLGGSGAIAFQFVQIGTDASAGKFLRDVKRRSPGCVDHVTLKEKLSRIKPRQKNDWDVWHKILCGAITKSANSLRQPNDHQDSDDEVPNELK